MIRCYHRRALRGGYRDFKRQSPEEDGRSGCLHVAITSKPLQDVQAVLEAERIKVSVQAEGSKMRIRVAPAFFNNAAEVKRFLAVAERF